MRSSSTLIDIPYSVHHPPVYRVTLPLGAPAGRLPLIFEPSRNDAAVELQRHFSQKKFKNDEVPEIYRVILEAFRALKEQYGDTIMFSKPEHAPSFIYRGESALLLPDFEDRFAWSIHFYQVARRGDSSEPFAERYGGLVFVRPWAVHLEAAKHRHSRHQALRHEYVTPATCEGCLRLRISQELSPSTTQVAHNYGAPYDARAFDSIPFYSPELGKSCGYVALAAALAMVNRQRQYTPFELAAVHASINGAEGVKRTSIPTCDGSVMARGSLLLAPSDIGDVVHRLGCEDIRVIVERRLPLGKEVQRLEARVACLETTEHSDEEKTKMFWDTLTEMLDNYLYVGLPVLFSVDVEKLYKDEKDDDLLKAPPTPTKRKHCHLVLIHSLIHSDDAKAAGKDRSQNLYVLSDTRNLHITGSVFHKVTAKRLWASAARPASHRVRGQGTLKTRNEDQAFAVCVPRDLLMPWWLLHQLFPDQHLFLRDRSQLRGFLINRVFNEEFLQYSASRALSEQIRQFRESVRLFNTSRYFWLVEKRTDTKSVEGLIIDTRSVPNEKTGRKPGRQILYLLGVYSLGKDSKVLDVWERQQGRSFQQVGFEPTSDNTVPPFRMYSRTVSSNESVIRRAMAILPESALNKVELRLR